MWNTLLQSERFLKTTGLSGARLRVQRIWDKLPQSGRYLQSWNKKIGSNEECDSLYILVFVEILRSRTYWQPTLFRPCMKYLENGRRITFLGYSGTTCRSNANYSLFGAFVGYTQLSRYDSYHGGGDGSVLLSKEERGTRSTRAVSRRMAIPELYSSSIYRDRAIIQRHSG